MERCRVCAHASSPPVTISNPGQRSHRLPAGFNAWGRGFPTVPRRPASSVSAELPTGQLGAENGDLGDGRSDVRRSALRHLLLEVAPVLLKVHQPGVLGLASLDLEEPEAVVEVSR
jgi:hypothetical protein